MELRIPPRLESRATDEFMPAPRVVEISSSQKNHEELVTSTLPYHIARHRKIADGCFAHARSKEHGLKHIDLRKGLLALFWILVFLLVMSILVSMITDLITSYVAMPVATQIKAEQEVLHFPDLSVCTKVPFYLSDETSSVNNETLDVNLQEMRNSIVKRMKDASIKITEAGIQGAFLIQMATKQDDTMLRAYQHLIYCQYQDKPCSFYNFTEIAHLRYVQCFTFSPSERDISAGRGLQFIYYRHRDGRKPFVMLNDLEDPSFTDPANDGIHIIIHNPSTFPTYAIHNMPTSFSLRFGQQATVEVSKLRYQSDRSGQKPCALEREPYKYTNFRGGANYLEYGYTYEDCIANRKQQLIYDKCKCFSDNLFVPFVSADNMKKETGSLPNTFSTEFCRDIRQKTSQRLREEFLCYDQYENMPTTSVLDQFIGMNKLFETEKDLDKRKAERYSICALLCEKDIYSTRTFEIHDLDEDLSFTPSLLNTYMEQLSASQLDQPYLREMWSGLFNNSDDDRPVFMEHLKPNDLIIVDVRISAERIDVWEEEITDTLFNFISNLGGTLGLCAGISFLSCLFLVIFFGRAFFHALMSFILWFWWAVYLGKPPPTPIQKIKSALIAKLPSDQNISRQSIPLKSFDAGVSPSRLFRTNLSEKAHSSPELTDSGEDEHLTDTSEEISEEVSEIDNIQAASTLTRSSTSESSATNNSEDRPSEHSNARSHSTAPSRTTDQQERHQAPVDMREMDETADKIAEKVTVFPRHSLNRGSLVIRHRDSSRSDEESLKQARLLTAKFPTRRAPADLLSDRTDEPLELIETPDGMAEQVTVFPRRSLKRGSLIVHHRKSSRSDEESLKKARLLRAKYPTRSALANLLSDKTDEPRELDGIVDDVEEKVTVLPRHSLRRGSLIIHHRDSLRSDEYKAKLRRRETPAPIRLQSEDYWEEDYEGPIVPSENVQTEQPGTQNRISQMDMTRYAMNRPDILPSSQTRIASHRRKSDPSTVHNAPTREHQTGSCRRDVCTTEARQPERVYGSSTSVDGGPGIPPSGGIWRELVEDKMAVREQNLMPVVERTGEVYIQGKIITAERPNTRVLQRTQRARPQEIRANGEQRIMLPTGHSEQAYSQDATTKDEQLVITISGQMRRSLGQDEGLTREQETMPTFQQYVHGVGKTAEAFAKPTSRRALVQTDVVKREHDISFPGQIEQMYAQEVTNLERPTMSAYGQVAENRNVRQWTNMLSRDSDDFPAYIYDPPPPPVIRQPMAGTRGRQLYIPEDSQFLLEPLIDQRLVSRYLREQYNNRPDDTDIILSSNTPVGNKEQQIQWSLEQVAQTRDQWSQMVFHGCHKLLEQRTPLPQRIRHIVTSSLN
ncbi:unnamed protein product [Dicrocoelium dendriticum]|nr:unnamed protein product [Dicrocoelium dendriticum]